MDELEDLKEKAQSELADLCKAESIAAHNDDMLKQFLTDQIGADDTTMKNAAEEITATAEGDLTNTVKDLHGPK